MGKITVTIEWEGLQGPYGPEDIQKLFDSHYKNHFKVRRLNLDTNEPPQKMTYSITEAATLLGISRAMAYSLVYQKHIPAVHYGKRWIIPKAALEKQLGGSIMQQDKPLINEIDRADLLATTDEALKLYDLLRGKLTAIVKNLSKGESN